MRILVTGANGQLGRELTSMEVEGLKIIGVGRTEMDVTSIFDVKKVIRDVKPHAVIHAAAYTAVDKAEAEPDNVYNVNALGTRNVAVAAEEVGARVCYVSTDYVFSGKSDAPYDEFAQTDPLTVYGRTKFAGEVLLQSLSTRWFIVRTAWVFGKYGGNFVKTMLAKSHEVQKMRVVNDQIGSPTYTRDLSEFLLALVRTDSYGIYHATNTGQCSWYEFARTIFDLAAIGTTLEPCTTEEFPRPAPRPRYSVLGQRMLRVNGFQSLRPWQDALATFLNELS